MPRSWHRRIPRVIASRARSRTPGSALPGPILRCTDRHSPPMAVPTVSTARLTTPRRARSQSRRASRREVARERLRACPSGKAAFPTRLGALLFASRVNIEGRSPNGGSLAAYRCPACSKWHLTSRRSSRNDGLPPGIVV